MIVIFAARYGLYLDILRCAIYRGIALFLAKLFLAIWL